MLPPIWARGWTALIHALFALGASYMLAIVIATAWDVIARNSVLMAPIWLGTFIELSLPTATMLAAPYLVRKRSHVSLELIDTMLSNRARKVLIVFTDLVAAAIAMVIAWYAATGGYDAWQRHEIVILAVDVQRWTLYALLVFGFALCAVEFLRHAAIGVAGLANGADRNGKTF